MENKLKKWRLILGREAEPAMTEMQSGFSLSAAEQMMDEALAAIYDETGGYGINAGGRGGSGSGSGGGAGHGKSSPQLAKWLTDVRNMFPPDLVTVIQADAINRKGLKQLLLEPETLQNIKPDIAMVSTIMALNKQIPEKAKDSARQLVKAVVDDLMQRMEQDLRQAVTGALNRKNHSPLPSVSGIDWKRTVQKNIRHYDLARQKLIPENFYFFERTRKQKEWTVILDMDQSGSMADSIIYASVMGAIFAAMPALDTRIVAFDTEVVDFTETCRNDPVDILFGVQLGGGTDINKSVGYCSQFIERAAKTLFILISDLYEGGVEAGLLQRLEHMRASGVTVLVLLALTDSGVPSYDAALAQKIAKLGIPCFACAPERLPELVEGALKGRDLSALAQTVKKGQK